MNLSIQWGGVNNDSQKEMAPSFSRTPSPTIKLFFIKNKNLTYQSNINGPPLMENKRNVS